MRVLVTGASGMIGSSVCDALLARGDEVVGLSRDPERARSTNPTVTWHPWSPALERPPAAALDGVNGVLNVIGESLNQRWTDDTMRRLTESRVQATHNLVQAIAAAEPRPAVLVSQCAIGYYGDRGDAVVDEDTPAGTSFDARLCASWEAAALEADRTGVRVAVTRSAPVLDKRGGLLKQLRGPFKLGLGGPIAGGDQYLPWIHIDDEVRILLWALDDERVSGPINAVAPEPVTNREFTRAVGHVLHRPTVIPVPKAALSVVFGGAFAAAVAGGQRAIPRRALDLGFEFRRPQLAGALRAELG